MRDTSPKNIYKWQRSMRKNDPRHIYQYTPIRKAKILNTGNTNASEEVDQQGTQFIAGVYTKTCTQMFFIATLFIIAQSWKKKVSFNR